MTHSPRARAALEALVEEDPAIAALSLWCAHRDGPETATQGSTITYAPAFAALPPHEQRGLAAHHVLHVALRHSARMADMESRFGAAFDADRWNRAADALVNEMVLLAGHALPRPALTLTALVEEADPATALSDWDVERLYHALGAAGRGAGDAGRFAADLKPQQTGSDGAKRGEEDAAWRQHLARALDAGRRAGRGLGPIGHRVADIPQPRTPWELILRALVSRSVTPLPRRSPARPARRWLAATAQATRAGTAPPGFEPGMARIDNVPRIAVALDASGSIDATRLALFWAEITGIARHMRAELHLMVFDDAIRHEARIDPNATPVPPPMPRDGGTAFAPVTARAEALKAAVLVILTDLDGEPGPPPRLPVIWAVPDAGARAAPYGRLLDLSA